MPQEVSQEDWNGVYYDRQAEAFVMMDVNSDSVTLVDAFMGTDYETLGEAEFKDCARDQDFDQVSPEIVRNPSDAAEQLLYEAAASVSGDTTGIRSYDPTDVDFIITATNLAHDDDAPYCNGVNPNE